MMPIPPPPCDPDVPEFGDAAEPPETGPFELAADPDGGDDDGNCEQA